MRQSPSFLAPGMGFVEDNFSTDGAGWVVGGSGGNVSDGERLHSLAGRSPPAVRPGS